jgi:hypothetical protein
LIGYGHWTVTGDFARPSAACTKGVLKLNPLENIWQFLRGSRLSNLVFETYDDIIDATCDAWRKLVA